MVMSLTVTVTGVFTGFWKLRMGDNVNDVRT